MSMTREEIAGAVARGYCTTANMYKELDADLVTGITNEVMALLESLSQEAVLEIIENVVTGGGPCGCKEPCDEYFGYPDVRCPAGTIAAIKRALKREPNAAALDRSTERASGERTSAGTSPSPAPAAPVAKMVKRLEDYAKHMKGSTEFPYGEGDLSRAAALLAKLGQGWVPETIWLCSNGDGAKHAFLKDPSGPCPFCQKNGKGNWSVYPLPLLGTPGASDD